MKGVAASMTVFYSLPQGIPDPYEVLILDLCRGSPWIVAEGPDGQRWVVEHWLVDCGFEYHWRGRYVHESHAGVLDELHHQLSRGWAHMPDSCNKPEWVASMTRTLRKVLLRNGRNPDAPPPEGIKIVN